LPRTRENKQEVVAALKADLQGVQLALVINYEGVTVAEITNLRQQLRPKGAICKITKNTLMRIAVQGDDAWEPITEFLKGNNAFVLIKEDLPRLWAKSCLRCFGSSCVVYRLRRNPCQRRPMKFWKCSNP